MGHGKVKWKIYSVEKGKCEANCQGRVDKKSYDTRPREMRRPWSLKVDTSQHNFYQP